jgi:hypothetical protein
VAELTHLLRHVEAPSTMDCHTVHSMRDLVLVCNEHKLHTMRPNNPNVGALNTENSIVLNKIKNFLNSSVLVVFVNSMLLLTFQA